MAVRIQIRRDPSTLWSMHNPVLAEGEPGFETDTGRFKIGDGVTAWNDLPYAGASPAGPDGAVQFNSGGQLAGVADFVWTGEKLVIDQNISNPSGFTVRSRQSNAEFKAEALGSSYNRKAGYYMALTDAVTAKVEFTQHNLYIQARSLDDSHKIIIGNNDVYITTDGVGLKTDNPSFPITINGITSVTNAEALIVSRGIPSSITDYQNIDFALSSLDNRLYTAHPIYLAKHAIPSGIPAGNVAVFQESETNHIFAKYPNGTRVLSLMGVDVYNFTFDPAEEYWIRIAESKSSYKYTKIRFLIKVYGEDSTEITSADFEIAHDYNFGTIQCILHSNIVGYYHLIPRVRYVHASIDAPSYIDIFVSNPGTAELTISVQCLEAGYLIDIDNDCLHPIVPIHNVDVPPDYQAEVFEFANRIKATYSKQNYEIVQRKDKVYIKDWGGYEPDISGIFGIQGHVTNYYKSDTDRYLNYYFYDVATSKTIGALGTMSTSSLRLMSNQALELYAGVTNFLQDDPSTAKATLNTAGRFIAKEFQPTNNYFSANGNAGYSGEIIIIGADSVYHHLLFENGILVDYSTS